MRRVLSQVLALVVLAGPAAAQQYATITGRVTGATSRRGVDAALIALDQGSPVRTGSHGDFVIKGVPPGNHRLRVSRIGYRPKTLSLPINAEDASYRIFVDVTLEPLPLELKPVVIRGDTTSVVAYGRLAEFYRHRRSGFGGRFITRQDIERRQPYRITDMLVAMPGIWSYDALGNRTFAFRATYWLPSRRPCGPAVFLDGARVPASVPVDDLISPQDVEGIEVYRGDLMTPLEYWGGCGAIAIWTR